MKQPKNQKDTPVANSDPSPEQKSVNFSDREKSEYTIERSRSGENRKKLSGLFSEWYGSAEEGDAAMIKFLPKTQSVGKILENVLRKKISVHTLHLQRIQENWQEIAGKTTARRCYPLRLFQKTLYLEISHPAYMQAIDVPQIKNAILQRIGELIGTGNCTDIKYVPSGRRMPAREAKTPGNLSDT